MGTAEALGHGTRTLLPQAVLADRWFGGTVAKDTVKFLIDRTGEKQEFISDVVGKGIDAGNVLLAEKYK